MRYKVKVGKLGKSRIVQSDSILEFHTKLKKIKETGLAVWLFNKEYKRYMEVFSFEPFFNMVKKQALQHQTKLDNIQKGVDDE